MKDKIEKKLKKLKRLVQYKGWSDDRLRDHIAQKMKDEAEAEKYKLDGEWSSPTEKKVAEKLFHDYLKSTYIQSQNQLNSLKDLVFIDVQKENVKKAITDVIKDKKQPTSRMYETLQSLIDKSESLKEKLFGTNQDDDYTALQTLMKKFKIWRKENQGTRTIICPHCSEAVLLKIRTDKYDASKHPFFKDRILTNQPMMEDYINGKITSEQIARYLECASDYIEHWIEHHFNKANPLYEQYLARKKKDEEKKS